MRCNNCGWQNSAGKLRCEKCNYPLSGSLNVQSESPAPPSEPQELQGTIKGTPSNLDPWDAPNQGPVTPAPGNPPVSAPPVYSAGGYKGTIDPTRQQAEGASPGFQMTPLNKEGEAPRPPLRFAGEEVVLNRDNVDPGNSAITSKEQACIQLIDGAWHIVDRSSLQTTFVQVAEPYQLKKGDVILLGNRKFIFDPE